MGEGVGMASFSLEVSQASVTGPSDRNRRKMKVKIKTFKWWKKWLAIFKNYGESWG